MINKSAKNYRLPYVLLCFLILFITSCNQSIETKIDHSIQSLIIKYPQLTADKKPSESEFKFVKSVREGEFNIEVQLYSQPEGYKNRNHILVFINSKKQIYAIPLFNSKYRDYWEFPFDKLLPNVPKTNTTFTNQLNLGIDELINNSDRRKSNKRFTLINVMLTSVLNCKRIEEKDSSSVLHTLRGSYDIPDENIDSAKIRLRKNYELMKREWHPEEFAYNYNCYFDETNARVYQIENLGNKFKIKTYRMDYGFHYIYL
ncbi:hypothetical protein ACQ9BO_04245 [Flavobacterium sp. P21]|uniref:hypothetical protein n=1 Tax=Flavobacterium sp. P21 TaxID=3423948 RepID=UPI003D66B7BF